MKKKSEFKFQQIVEEEPNLKGDYRNVMILFLLYVLQGSMSLFLSGRFLKCFQFNKTKAFRWV